MAEPVVAERNQRDPNKKPWWWLTGDTYPHRELLKRYGARFSQRRKAWYFIGWVLPAAIQQLVSAPSEETPIEEAHDADPCPVEVAAAILGLSVKPADHSPGALLNHDKLERVGEVTSAAESVEPPDQASKPKASSVRVIKPSSLPPDGTPPDAVQSAIEAMKALPSPRPLSTPSSTIKMMRIKQVYCGELTGSVSGQVFCYGYATHEEVCVYVNMGGPRVSVEAIRAKLGKGDIVTLVPDDAPAIELTAGEGNSGMYTDYLQTIPEARFTSLILLHDSVIHPNYNGASTTFLLQVSEAQAKSKLKQHVAQLVNVPVFDDWVEFLWAAGQAAFLLRPTHSAGSINLLTLSLDATAWTRLITGGVEQQIIQLPAIS
ncbi:MAG: hypothetical protein ABI700_00455 [Chloroflexota bacterium]